MTIFKFSETSELPSLSTLDKQESADLYRVDKSKEPWELTFSKHVEIIFHSSPSWAPNTTLSVAPTDILQVQKGQWVQVKIDGQWFRITDADRRSEISGRETVLSTSGGVITLLASESKASGDIELAGSASAECEAYWSGDRQYTLVNNSTRNVTFRIDECLIGCTTRVVRVGRGRSQELTLMGQGIGIKPPISAEF